MILLDTDHVSHLKYTDSERGQQLAERLQALPADEIVAVPIIAVEEQMRGWMAAISKERDAARQVFAYRELARLFEFFSAFTIAHFDEAAANQFKLFKSARIRLGTMDLKIAAIACTNSAVL